MAEESECRACLRGVPHDLTHPSGPVRTVYSREDALEDGLRVDVSEVAQVEHFRLPVDLTKGVVALIEDEDHSLLMPRLHDLLREARVSITHAAKPGSMKVQFNFATTGGYREVVAKVTRDGPDGSPMAVLMLPQEA